MDSIIEDQNFSTDSKNVQDGDQQSAEKRCKTKEVRLVSVAIASPAFMTLQTKLLHSIIAQPEILRSSVVQIAVSHF